MLLVVVDNGVLALLVLILRTGIGFAVAILRAVVGAVAAAVTTTAAAISLLLLLLLLLLRRHH